MKKYIFVIITIILLFISCPTELIKGTIWYGHIEFNNEKVKIKVHIFDNSTITIYVNSSSESQNLRFDGTYTLGACR